MDELDQNLTNISNKVHDLLESTGINYKEVEHEPVFDYEAAERVRKRFNLIGAESKSLFLKSKDEKFFMLATLENRRADLKAVKELIGKKVSIASGEELQQQTGCLPGCAVPLGLPREVTIIVDNAIFGVDKFIFSPGLPTQTVQVNGSDLQQLFDRVKARQPVLFLGQQTKK